MKVLAPDRDRLAASSEEVKRTIDIVWSAYRSVLSKEGRLAYASTAITSGLLMYDALDELGLASADELKAKHPAVLFDRIIRPNIEQGTAKARIIAARVDHPVVAPAIFEAKKQRWSQDEYMAMWLRMIEESVGVIYMMPGWEYSNGGAEEFLHAVQMSLGFRSRHDIKILDADDKPISFHVGLSAIGRALRDLHRRKRKAPILADVFKSLSAVWGVWHAPEIGRDELPANYNHEFLWSGDNGVVSGEERGLARLLADEYGIKSGYEVNTGTGVPRKNDATPEGIVLKAEDPPKGE